MILRDLILPSVRRAHLLGAALLPALAAPASAAPAPHGCHVGLDVRTGRTLHAHEELAAQYPALQQLLGGGGGAGLVVAPEFLSHVCIAHYLEPPAGWMSGDSHTHHEDCADILPDERLYFGSECLAEMFMGPRDVQLSTPLLWGTRNLDNQPFSFPGFVDGECIEAGEPAPVFRRDWEGYTDGGGAPVAGLVEELTGEAESFFVDYLPFGVPLRERVLQNGIEISGWHASRWGHIGALNVSPELGGNIFANYDELAGKKGCAPLFDGDAEAAPDLAQDYPFEAVVQHYECGLPGPPPVPSGHRNDGTGNWSRPLFEIFERDKGALTGYMHQFWPIATAVEDPSDGPGIGWDWLDHLGAGYAAEEIECFPTDMRAAFPDNFEKGNTAWPLLAGPDAALGYVDYLEAYNLTVRGLDPNTQPTAFSCGGSPVTACGEEDHHQTPTDAWFGMYYKLLSVGLRPGVTAGTDGTCAAQCTPQTYVRVGDTAGLTPSEVYDAYTEGIAAGRVSLATERYHFLDMRVDGAQVGETVELDGPGQVDVTISYTLDLDLLIDPQSEDYFFAEPSGHFDEDDRVLELVRDGVVVAAHGLEPADFVAGTATVSFSGVDFTKSGWLAARTRSTSVHTGATIVTVDGEPVASCLEAEYWMIYCDYVQSKIDAYEACQVQTDSQGAAVVVPEFLEQHVGCSQPEIETHLAQARKVFRSVRDFAGGDLPGVCRHGEKQSTTCGEPIAIVVGGEVAAQPNTELRISCINAPPDALGLLLVGSDFTGGTITPGPQPPYFVPDVEPIPVFSNHGGHQVLETTLGTGFPPSGTVFLQYVWLNPPGCDGESVLSWTRALSLTVDPSSPFASCP